MRVRPNDNARSIPYISQKREYYVIGLSYTYFRVVDDYGEPILIPRDAFEVLDEFIPSDWIWERFSDDEYYANPPELSARGFYEAYFDGKEEAIRCFESYIKRLGSAKFS